MFTRSLDSTQVKSRLGAAIGSANAHSCYRELLSNTLQCARDFNTIVYVDGPIEDETWLLGLTAKPQAQGDLGERMLACFEDGVAVLVGGDCPLMSVAYIQEAFKSLSSNDLVIGPTEDGGYVLIAMNEPIKQLFYNIPWSTEDVFRATIDVARTLGLRVKCLDQVWDVDTETDYVRWLDLKEE